MKAARDDRRRKVAKKEEYRRGAGRASRRNDGRLCPGERESQSSRHHKLERKRVAAAGSRRVYRRREGERNRLRPEDFGARALWRANGMSPIVDRRSSANRSSCGRRTSLERAQLSH